MRYRSIRPLCRGLFLLCCVVPTLAIGVWSLARIRPGQAQQYADRVARRTGLRVELDGHTRPRPGVSRLDGLRLADPESGQRIASFQLIKMARGNDHILATAEGATVQRDTLPRLWDLLHNRILRQMDDLPSAAHVRCGEVALRDADGVTIIRHVGGRIEHIAAGPKATWRFRLSSSRDHIRVTITRDHRGERPVTRFTLDTGQSPLPCSLLHPFSEAVKSLGRHAVFQGCVWAQRSDEGWEGELTGLLGGVDLGELVGWTSAHQLTGNSTVLIRGMRFKGSQIDSARGSVSAGPGKISGSFINAAVDVLGLSPVGQSPTAPHLDLPYRQLELGFVIDSSELTLSGRCRKAPTGTVMVLADPHRSRLAQPTEQPLPVVRLIRALVPQHELQVPATRETWPLLRALRLPPIAAQNGRVATDPSIGVDR